MNFRQVASDMSNCDSYREWIRFAIEVLALIFLIRYVHWTKVQSLATEAAARAAKESADAAVASIRPWIAESGWEITGDPVERTYPIIIKFKNVGKSLASDIVVYLEYRIAPQNSPPKFEKCPTAIVRKMIPIPADQEFSINEQLPKFPDDEAAMLKGGKASLFIHGCVDYRDAWHPAESRLTEFCGYLFPASLVMVCEPNLMK